MKLILLSFIAFLSFSSNAQFGNFWNTRAQKNPAFLVLTHKHFVNANHRNIWPALSGNYESNTLTYGMFVKKLSGGVGIYYNNDNWGRTYKSNAVKLTYNFQKQLGRHTRVSVGTGIGLIHTKYSNSFYPIYDIPTQGNALGIDIGAALVWRKLQVGIGIENAVKTNDVERNLNGDQRFNFTAQYAFGKESGFQFFPQVLVETDLVFSQTMINGKLGYKNKFFLASGIILNNTIMYSGELFLWNKTRVTYTYQQTINSLNKPNAGSHEIGLCIELKKKPTKRKISGTPSF